MEKSWTRGIFNAIHTKRDGAIEWGRMKHSVEYNTFSKAVERIMAVPKSEILRREEEYKKRAALNPRRRGPKRKAKT